MNHTHSKNQSSFYVKPREGKIYWKTEKFQQTKFVYSTYSLNNEALSLYKHHRDEEGHIWSTCIAIIPLNNIAMFVPHLEDD